MSTTINNLIVNNLNVKTLAINEQLQYVNYDVYNTNYNNPSPLVNSQPVPTVNEPVLMYNGLPQIFLVSEDNCPFCAVAKWGLLLALSRFGVYTDSSTFYSSPTDVYPNTPGMSVASMSYVSNYISFVSVTLLDSSSNVLQLLTASQLDILNKFDTYPWVPSVDDYAVPFISFGNQFIQNGAPFSPGLLAGLSQADITANLSDSTNKVTQAIITSANNFTRCILRLTNNMPGGITSFLSLQYPSPYYLHGLQRPFGIVSDGTYVWVANTANGTVSVFQIDKMNIVIGGENSLVKTIAVGNNPQSICYDNNYVWVANFDDGTVSKINRVTQRVVDTITTGGTPNSICSDNVHVYVATLEQNISVIDIESSVVSTVSSALTGGCGFVCLDKTYIWCAGTITGTGGSVVPLLKSTMIPGNPIPGFSDPKQLVSNGKYVWVPNLYDSSGAIGNKVQVIEIGTMKIISSITVGQGPICISYNTSYGTPFVVVSNVFDGSVSNIDTQKVIKTWKLTGFSGGGISFDGTNIWVANRSGDDIAKLL
jgi:YVTN family beta-propeller protein